MSLLLPTVHSHFPSQHLRHPTAATMMLLRFEPHLGRFRSISFSAKIRSLLPPLPLPVRDHREEEGKDPTGRARAGVGAGCASERASEAMMRNYVFLDAESYGRPYHTDPAGFMRHATRSKPANPTTSLASPPKPRSQLVVPPCCSSSSAAATSLVRSPLTAASIGSQEFARQSGVVRSCVVARASASDISPDISDALGDVRIFTASGQPVMFMDLLDQNEGMAVVALLRHFGCPCCWELASALKESKAKFDSAGVKLIAVGVGTPNKARILAERLPFPMDCLYADPERK
ncbi:hypothetical protein NL676_022766 [Syzygium grande]|nr:hypothetical protein NL676_022766 [Syzygium grande]